VNSSVANVARMIAAFIGVVSTYLDMIDPPSASFIVVLSFTCHAP